MPKRFRQFIDSVVFAGLKPDAHREQVKRKRWLGLGWLQSLADRVLSRPAPSDPLYLSNRTFDQKMKLAVAIAIPCVVVVAGVVLLLTNYFDANAPGPAPEPSAAVLAAQLLPNLDKTIQIEVNKDVQVLDAHVVDDGGGKVVGTVKNNTGRLIHTAQIALNLTDMTGSHVGAVDVKVDNLAPNATAKFQVPTQAKNVSLVLVREVVTQ